MFKWITDNSRHFAPHNALFEGWYTRFYIPSTGESVILVICSVPKAHHRPHMVSLTYVGAQGQLKYQKELWVPSMDMRRTPKGWAAESLDPRHPQTVVVMQYASGTVSYDVSCEDFYLAGDSHTTTPWAKGKRESTPAGWLVNLPLPLQWHVHSLASEAKLSLGIPAAGVKLADGARAIAHQEKNWADSFPSAHMWLQGFAENTVGDNQASRFCLAGGRVWKVLEAYVFTFQSETVDVYFRPPLTLSIFGVSLLCSTRIDWPARTFRIEARGWRRRIEVVATAPKDTFFNLSAPFAEGHREKALAQSLAAEIRVKVWLKKGRLGWLGLGPWVLEAEQTFHKAGLEFGGENYGDFNRGPGL